MRDIYDGNVVDERDIVFKSEQDKEFARRRYDHCQREIVMLVDWAGWKQGQTYKLGLGVAQTLIDYGRAKLADPSRYDPQMTDEQVEELKRQGEEFLEAQKKKLAGDIENKSMSKKKTSRKNK